MPHKDYIEYSKYHGRYPFRPITSILNLAIMGQTPNDSFIQSFKAFEVDGNTSTHSFIHSHDIPLVVSQQNLHIHALSPSEGHEREQLGGEVVLDETGRLEDDGGNAP